MSELEAEWTKNAPHTSFNHWLEQEVLRLRAIEAAAREVAKAVPFGCDRIRELAFDLPAPNEKTPQLMGIAIELTRLAEKLRLALSGGEGK